MAQKERTTVVLQVSIRPSTFDSLAANMQGVAPSDALSGMCSLFLENTACGGVALTPDQVSQIQKNWGKTVTGGKDVVRATESQKDLENGQGTYKFSIDPSFVPPLNQRAMEVGRPVGELMSDVVDYALANNWIYSITYEGKRRTFPPAIEDKLAEVIGKSNFTVYDILERLKEFEKAARKNKKEELVEA